MPWILGCGTGLMGPLLRPLSLHLEGVDLSPRMLEEARAKGVYDALAVAEITQHVEAMTASPDLVTAADVLVYIGDLDPLLRAVAGKLAPGGLLLISTEAIPAGVAEAGFKLLPTGRYAHARAYVEAVGRSHGLTLLASETAVIRQDEGQPIGGGLHLLRREAAADDATSDAAADPDAARGQALARAEALQATGRQDEAAAVCEGILATAPDQPAALRRLGLIERARGRAAAAHRIWERLLRSAPDDPALHRLAGEDLASLHEFAAAAGHFARADALKPDDPGILLGLGAMLLQQGQADAALASLHRAAELAPRHAAIHFELARALASTGAMAEARTVLDKIRGTGGAGGPSGSGGLGLSSDGLGYLEHLVEGRDGGAASVARLQRIYDQAAPHYESHVIVRLENRIWRQLIELLDADMATAGRIGMGLDLGCGPGLAGTELRRRVDHLTGVDLSTAMLEQAGRRDAYDRLVASDLMAFLSDPAEADAYDLMFASDVLIHIGDLVALLTVVASRLRPGGIFLFSTEHSDDLDCVPLPEFRFRHSLGYVEQAATAAGLALATHEVRQIRVERGAPVMGGLYLLRQPS